MSPARVVKKCAIFALLVMIYVGGAADAAVTTPVAFEDRNNNGVFDAGDVDISEFLRLKWIFKTAQSVVITGPIKITEPNRDPDTSLCRGLFITAGKNITVNGSITNPGYAGSLLLSAGGRLTIGSKVTLNARTHVELISSDSIVIGDSVKMYAKGEGAFFYGAVTATSARDITVGQKFVAQTVDNVTLHSLAGNLAVGPGAQITTERVHLDALGSITADGARLKGKTLVSVFSMSGSGPISLRSSASTVGLDGSIQISAATGTVDLTAATFNVTPDVTARTIID